MPPELMGHFDAASVLADDRALAAVRRVALALRGPALGGPALAGPALGDSELGGPGLGSPAGGISGSPPASALRAFTAHEEVDGPELAELIGPAGLEALVAGGALEEGNGKFKARFRVLVSGRVLAVVPPQQRDRGDLAYLGPDSIWLLQRAWPLATGGRLAVELGTGTGYLAASLAPRYELTIGTEVLGTTAAVAALTFHLNGPSKLCCLLADVAAPLRPRCADFVIANAPWVPTRTADSSGRPMTYAYGGPTGQELPARFIVEGAGLLAPGGTMIVACLDLTYDNGRRPFAEVCAAIEERGLTTVIEPAGQPEISRRISEHLRGRGIPATAQLCYVIVEHDV